MRHCELGACSACCQGDSFQSRGRFAVVQTYPVQTLAQRRFAAFCCDTVLRRKPAASCVPKVRHSCRWGQERASTMQAE